jgi:uncharacterized repeat protein (TIGR03803 family)
MSLSSWLTWTLWRSHARRAKPRNPATTSLHRRRSFRPGLEALETRLTPSLTALASFNVTNGSYPRAGLVMDSSGNLYGETFYGGPSDFGTVFELAQGSGTITMLASFNGTNSSAPYGGLVMDSSGNLYGTASGSAGSNDDGTVFELAQGSSTITTLARFNGSNGSTPFAGLIMDSSGNLYGETFTGGAYSRGTVFELAQGSGTITTLASFNGESSAPRGGLIMDSSGNLYGTGEYGAAGYGTVFELAQGSGRITTLAYFIGTNGAYPFGGVVMDSSGNLYGTTAGSESTNDGTVFELAQGSGTITTLARFNGTNGQNPDAGLIMDSSGNLYGTTFLGGADGDGTVFELAQGSRTITTLDSFNGTNGSLPLAACLIMDGSGNLYGTTYEGGASAVGTVFELPGGVALPSFQISGIPSSISAGTPQTFTVTVQNADGTTDTGYTGTVTFTSADPYGATLPGDYTFTAADAGVHTFAAGATLYTAGTWDVTATDTATSSITGTVNVTVVAAPAVAFQVLAPTSAVSGTPFDVTVVAVDPYGNTDTGYTGTITFSSSDGDPAVMLPADYTFQASDLGVVTFAGGATLITLGDQTVTATDTLSGITGTATVTVTTGPDSAHSGPRISAAPAASLPLASSPPRRADTNADNVATTASTSTEPPPSAATRRTLAAIDQFFGTDADLLTATWYDPAVARTAMPHHHRQL